MPNYRVMLREEEILMHSHLAYPFSFPSPPNLPNCSGPPGVPLLGYVSVCKPQLLDCVQYRPTSSVREITAVFNLNVISNSGTQSHAIINLPASTTYPSARCFVTRPHPCSLRTRPSPYCMHKGLVLRLS